MTEQGSKTDFEQTGDRFPIRIAELADIQPIAEINIAVFAPTYLGVIDPVTETPITQKQLTDHVDSPNFKERIRNSIANGIENPHATIFVACENNTPIGFCMTTIDANNHQWISGLYLQKNKQGQGIGKRLLNKALAWGDTNADVYLDVVAGIPAETFYTKFAFEPTGYTWPSQLESGGTLPQKQLKLPGITRRTMLATK